MKSSTRRERRFLARESATYAWPGSNDRERAISTQSSVIPCREGHQCHITSPHSPASCPAERDTSVISHLHTVQHHTLPRGTSVSYNISTQSNVTSHLHTVQRHTLQRGTSVSYHISTQSNVISHLHTVQRHTCREGHQHHRTQLDSLESAHRQTAVLVGEDGVIWPLFLQNDISQN